MPSLSDFLSPQAVLADMRATNKKQAIEELSALASQETGLSKDAIFDALLQRERLGSTGVGDGVAIPHGKIHGLQRLFGAVARLEKPVDFEALDSQPVDVLFLLLAPEDAGADHLKALARVARLFRGPATLERIRAAHDADALYMLLTQSEDSPAA